METYEGVKTSFNDEQPWEWDSLTLSNNDDSSVIYSDRRNADSVSFLWQFALFVFLLSPIIIGPSIIDAILKIAAALKNHHHRNQLLSLQKTTNIRSGGSSSLMMMMLMHVFPLQVSANSLETQLQLIGIYTLIYIVIYFSLASIATYGAVKRKKKDELDCFLFIFALIEELASKSATYFAVFFHVIDQATDIQACLEYYQNWQKQKKDGDYKGVKPETVDIEFWFYMSVFILLFHRTVSTIGVWLASNSPLNTFLQLFDLAMVRAVYAGHCAGQSVPGTIQRYLQSLEAIFESFPQLVLSLVYLLRTREANSVIIVQTIFSIYTLSDRICQDDALVFPEEWELPGYNLAMVTVARTKDEDLTPAQRKDTDARRALNASGGPGSRKPTGMSANGANGGPSNNNNADTDREVHSISFPLMSFYFFARVFIFRLPEVYQRVAIISLFWAVFSGPWTLFLIICDFLLCKWWTKYFFSGTNPLAVTYSSVDFYDYFLYFKPGFDHMNVYIFIRPALHALYLGIIVLFSIINPFSIGVTGFNDRKKIFFSALSQTLFIYSVICTFSPITFYLVCSKLEMDVYDLLDAIPVSRDIRAVLQTCNWRTMAQLVGFGASTRLFLDTLSFRAIVMVLLYGGDRLGLRCMQQEGLDVWDLKTFCATEIPVVRDSREGDMFERYKKKVIAITFKGLVVNNRKIWVSENTDENDEKEEAENVGGGAGGISTNNGGGQLYNFYGEDNFKVTTERRRKTTDGITEADAKTMAEFQRFIVDAVIKEKKENGRSPLNLDLLRKSRWLFDAFVMAHDTLSELLPEIREDLWLWYDWSRIAVKHHDLDPTMRFEHWNQETSLKDRKLIVAEIVEMLYEDPTATISKLFKARAKKVAAHERGEDVSSSYSSEDLETDDEFEEKDQAKDKKQPPVSHVASTSASSASEDPSSAQVVSGVAPSAVEPAVGGGGGQPSVVSYGSSTSPHSSAVGSSANPYYHQQSSYDPSMIVPSGGPAARQVGGYYQPSPATAATSGMVSPMTGVGGYPQYPVAAPGPAAAAGMYGVPQQPAGMQGYGMPGYISGPYSHAAGRGPSRPDDMV